MRATGCIRWVITLIAIASAQEARAFPAFARKYGMACSACHVAWPIFNQQGQNFRDNGYQFRLGKDDPVALRPEYLPISLRTTVGYQFTRTTNQPAGTSDAPFPVVTRTGGIPAPSVDVLTGGTIATDLSFLLVISGFNPADGLASVESAWARLDRIAGNDWLNLKVGKFELDQPASSHRAITLLYNYAAYSAKLPGSAVAFDMAENQLGLELDGHSARSTTRYALSLVSANGDPGSTGAFSSPLLYGHVQQAFELGSTIVPWIRVGALGAVGWWPTEIATFTTTTPGTALVAPRPSGFRTRPALLRTTSRPVAQTVSIPGTGTNLKQYYRAGAELSWLLGYPSTPLFFTVAYIYGRENAGLASGTAPDGSDLSASANHFNSGFAELDWSPFIELVGFLRYDAVRYGTPPGDVDAGTIGLRYYLVIAPRASMALHLEGHVDRNRGFDPVSGGPSFNGQDVVVQSVLAALDFIF